MHPITLLTFSITVIFRNQRVVTPFSCSPPHIANISPSKSFAKKGNSVRFRVDQRKPLVRQETTEMFFPSVKDKLNNGNSHLHLPIQKSSDVFEKINQWQNARQLPSTTEPIFVTTLPLPSSTINYGNYSI